jgi:hypothetical protein
MCLARGIQKITELTISSMIIADIRDTRMRTLYRTLKFTMRTLKKAAIVAFHLVLEYIFSKVYSYS